MLWLEKAVEAAGQPQMVFLSKAPHKTLWLLIGWQTPAHDAWVKAFLDDAAKRGWTEDTTFKPASPLPGNYRTVEIQKPGSESFHDWTDAERKVNLRDIKAMLAGYGRGFHHYKLTMADCM